jgi:hypothetical protein
MSNLTEELLQQVWEKAEAVKGYDASKYRKDVCGAWIIRSQHGKTLNLYGWSIDLIIPIERGGTYEIENLRAVQWQNALSKEGGKIVCKVRSADNGNYELTKAQLIEA